MTTRVYPFRLKAIFLTAGINIDEKSRKHPSIQQKHRYKRRYQTVQFLLGVDPGSKQRCPSLFYSSVTLTEAKASTAQLGYWSREGNIRLMNVRMNSGKRPSTMLCLTERIRVSCGEKRSMN